MRWLTTAEKKKRGCLYCADLELRYSAHKGGKRRACSHEECPYTVLDKYDTYEDYMKSKDSKLDIAALFDAGGSGGRVTPGAMAVYPKIRRLGKSPLF